MRRPNEKLESAEHAKADLEAREVRAEAERMRTREADAAATARSDVGRNIIFPPKHCPSLSPTSASRLVPPVMDEYERGEPSYIVSMVCHWEVIGSPWRGVGAVSTDVGYKKRRLLSKLGSSCSSFSKLFWWKRCGWLRETIVELTLVTEVSVAKREDLSNTPREEAEEKEPENARLRILAEARQELRSKKNLPCL